MRFLHHACVVVHLLRAFIRSHRTDRPNRRIFHANGVHPDGVRHHDVRHHGDVHAPLAHALSGCMDGVDQCEPVYVFQFPRARVG